MCGIVGYIGHRDAISFLIPGLRRLEYLGLPRRYYLGVLRGCDVDKPRNLVNSVMVE